MKLNLTNSEYRLNIAKTGNIAFLFFVICYTVYMIFLADKLDFSYDEPYSLYTSANSLKDVVLLSYQFEFQPPAYFVILSFWRQINDGILFARLLSVIFTLLSAFFLYKVIRLIFNNISSKWVVVIFLLNPFTVWSGTEIRLYSFLVLLTILSFYLFYLIYFFDKNNLKIVFVLISVIGVYTQYFFVFLIMSFAVVLLLSKKWRYFLNYILLSFVIAVLFIPNLIFLAEQFAVNQDSLVDYTVYTRIKSVLMSSMEFFSLETGFNVGRIGRWIIRFTFIFLYGFTFWKFYVKNKIGENQDFRNFNYVLLQTIFLFFIFITAFSFADLVFAIRYVTILFPFHILLLVIFGLYSPKIRDFIYFIFAAFLLINVATTFKPPYKKSYDFRSIANYTQQIQKENEPVLFLNNDLTLGLRHIFDSDESFISLPEFQYNENLYTNYVKDTTELNELITNIKSVSPSFLLITGTDLGYLRNKDLTNEMIDKYLENNYLIPVDTVMEGNIPVDFMRIRRIIKNR
jgi:4-amino-4-deoxy-L-arabinose transferase-like glycosyltransferase